MLLANSPYPETPTPPRLATVPRVEIFIAGNYDDEVWDTDRVDEIVRNSALTADEFTPPVVLGHDQAQPWLAQAGLPAAGWVGSLSRMGQVLVADRFFDVPLPIAMLIQQRSYKQVSCEFYPTYTMRDGTELQHVLKRVCLLGADVPRAKGLADVPLPYFADRTPTTFLVSRPVVKRNHGRIYCFSEVHMDRPSMIAALTAAGYDAALLGDEVPDPLIQAMYDHLTPEQKGEKKAEDTETTTTNTDGGNDVGIKAMAMFSEMNKKFASVQSDVKKLRDENKQLRDENKARTEREAKYQFSEKEKKVDTFILDRRRAGKISAAELDDSKGTGLKRRLMERDDSRIIKFSDTVSYSDLDRELAAIDARPVLFKEQEQVVARPKGANGRSDAANRLLAATDEGQVVLAKKGAN